MTGHGMEVRDERVALAAGEVFVRRWRPPGADGRIPMLLFHDSLGSVELWRDFPARLAAASGRLVVAYDRIGFGRSAPRSDRLRPGFVEAEAAVAAELAGRFGLSRLVPLGHSVGGGMAVATAALSGLDCPAVVTMAAQSCVEPRTLDGIRAAKAGFAEPGQMERLARYHGDKAAWVLDAWTETWLSADFSDWRLDDALAALRSPVLALHGDRDEYGSGLHPRRIAGGRPPPSRSVILEDCGHVPQRERPEAVLAAVVAFLAEAVPTGRIDP